MLSRIKAAMHKVLSGAANSVAPTNASSGLGSTQVSIDELIKYPPETMGIPIVPLDNILTSQNEMLRLMHRDSGFPDADAKSKKSNKKKNDVYDLNFDTLYRQVIKNYIAYIHLLPASENHHHSDVGGLVRHSLEVALYSMRKGQQQVLPAVGHLDHEQLRKPRWQYAAWVCGLLHDAGKILFDMRVYDVKSGVDWNPYLTDLYTWAKENKVERYRVTWRPENRHKKHENLSGTVLEWILTPEAKSYLMDNADELPIAINHALAHYGNNEGYLQTCVRTADSASTERDIKTQWHEMLGKRRYPLESAIVNAMRRLRDGWEVNTLKGHVWIIGDEVHITWPKTIQLVVQCLQADKVDVPINPSKILEILEERNLVTRLDESASYSIFMPDMENVEGPEKVIRLSWPGLLYETMPTPKSVHGKLRLNANGDTIVYKSDGTTSEIKGQEDSDQNQEPVLETKVAVKETYEKESAQGSNEKSGATQAEKAKVNPRKRKPSNTTSKNKSTHQSKKTSTATPKNKGFNALNIANDNDDDELIVKEGVNKLDDIEPDLQVPDYLTEAYDDEPPFESDKQANNESMVDAEQIVEDVVEVVKPKTKPEKQNKPTKNKKKSPVDSMLKRRKQFANSTHAKPVGWLGESKKGRSDGDAYLIDLANAIANNELNVSDGKGIYLTDSQLHIDSQFVNQKLSFDIASVTAALKKDLYLSYDSLKPNLLVQRKELAGDAVMVFSLTKAASKKLCKELGISSKNVNYKNTQNTNTKVEVNENAKSDVINVNKKIEQNDEVSLFLAFLAKSSLSDESSEYLSKSQDDKHWCVMPQVAIRVFMKTSELAINKNNLSKELTLLSDGTIDIDNENGRKKHLLIANHLIG